MIDPLIPDKFKAYNALGNLCFLLLYPETDAETIQAHIACACSEEWLNPEIRYALHMWLN